MKKALSWALCIIMLLCLGGCSSDAKEEYIKAEVDNTQEIDNIQPVKEDISDEIKASEVNNSKEQPKIEKVVISRKTVVIDPGHGAGGNKLKERESPDSDIMKIKDPGGAQGISTGIPEYVINMKVSLKLKELLEQNNVLVIMTKTENNVSPGNIERAEVGNANNADLAIRIHCDSAENKSANGASMLVPAAVGNAKDINNISKEYGQTILNELVSQAGMYNRGVVEKSDLTGFNWSKVPVVLVEMGFMSNSKEDNLLNDDTYENKLAQGLCSGILKALKIA